MRPIPAQKISIKALKVWRFTAFLESLLFTCIPIGYWLFVYFFQWPIWIFYVLLFLFLIVAFLNIFVIPTLRWKKWRYEVFETEIELQYGVFIVRRVLIPMVRVQHVDTQQGPLLRRYKLASVTISTAATTHQIPALSEDVADQLRNLIASLATVADEYE
ncbi:PH domain-containing protein [Anaerobacillus sp. MEB173]|uniref:PH domain-containing protein n=1 Tax=Anaerobacillus sp. MEB173 TaxID=3383345 RepID=UPI003F92ECCC